MATYSFERLGVAIESDNPFQIRFEILGTLSKIVPDGVLGRVLVLKIYPIQIY